MLRPFALLVSLSVSPLTCGSEGSPGAPRERPSERQPAEAQAEAEAEPPAPPETIEARMQDHFTAVTRVVDAIVDGDLEAAHEASAAVLEQVSATGLPPEWSGHVARMREAARAVEQAESIPAAGIEAGTMLATCGGCHASVGAQPRFAQSVAPSMRETAAAEMERHQWALARLSEGLVGPSDEAWTTGAQGVGSSPKCARAAAEEVADAATVEAVVARFDELAARTGKTQGQDRRGRLYGELLGTCAACHQSGC
jgi:cytochrome c553